ncbi:MAG: exodeoxyribonuclease III [Bacteroidetes bacterium HGW-Bacteroidetes-11]|jgi:exodeoxyribonuclease-3|nr:MAG: exodeoxyribonuclease III [Bacteroidetes bacterium HGW-Bacteroidetes-11]
MKIITYNVNGIRSALSKGLITWIMREKPDVLCLQETKAQPDQIPVDELQALGYHCHWFSAEKKGYSGVGLLSLKQPDNVVYGMGIDQYDTEGRLIRADFGDLTVISAYHPSGTTGEFRQSFKMEWLEDFYDYAHNLLEIRPNLILSGDYNICHRAIDIHDPIRNATNSGFLPEERDWMEDFLNSGFTDTFRYFNKNPHNYTWWSYRAGARTRNLGWRIDYNMVSNSLRSKLLGAWISSAAIHSDHCPVGLELEDR